jgi:hypothetical protein
MMSLMEVARVNTCVGALVGGAAMGVGVEPHAEAITTSVISIIEIGDALIFWGLLVEFQLVLCAAYWRCCSSSRPKRIHFRSNGGYLGIPKTVGRIHGVRQNVFDMVYYVYYT